MKNKIVNFQKIVYPEKNIRILFSFQIVRGEEKVILYNVFEENRTKDYSFEISKAKVRRRQLFGK